ncbi:uncharacterized protein EV420DRAFT_1472364 [Desarmillaria tabescens]|uniref:Uncharacterized protein n=1 Tax=Armillaria tabescens TaxID=1929756 RepID=A0AA39NNU6_ARMTA|nr:uncharacterized protein EV420DRAFT_1472364 [Desarmillaria tabescens]KAK0469068.1 hypothetical protein EV420DRAFT_1472364 [Desarmillaria tabescens]
MVYSGNPTELLSLLEYKETPLNGEGGTATRVTTPRPNVGVWEREIDCDNWIDICNESDSRHKRRRIFTHHWVVVSILKSALPNNEMPYYPRTGNWLLLPIVVRTRRIYSQASSIKLEPNPKLRIHSFGGGVANTEKRDRGWWWNLDCTATRLSNSIKLPCRTTAVRPQPDFVLDHDVRQVKYENTSEALTARDSSKTAGRADFFQRKPLLWPPISPTTRLALPTAPKGRLSIINAVISLPGYLNVFKNGVCWWIHTPCFILSNAPPDIIELFLGLIQDTRGICLSTARLAIQSLQRHILARHPRDERGRRSPGIASREVGCIHGDWQPKTARPYDLRWMRKSSHQKTGWEIIAWSEGGNPGLKSVRGKMAMLTDSENIKGTRSMHINPCPVAQAMVGVDSPGYHKLDMRRHEKTILLKN